ncbi:MAG: FecR domain-containing protein [Phormidesmis sp.]
MNGYHSKRTLSFRALSAFLGLAGGLAGILFLPRPVSAEQQPLEWARIDFLRNRVQLVPREERARRARISDILSVGDALRTARSSRAELRFSDGSLARIGERATFRFTPNTRNFQLTNGTVLLLIPPERGRSTIQTPNAVTGIQGSALFVRYIPETNTTIVGALTDNPKGPMVLFNADGSEQQALRANEIGVIEGNQITQLYQFDSELFWQSSGLAEGIDYSENSSSTNASDPLQAVHQEIREAIQKRPFIEGEGVIENPDSFNRPGSSEESPSTPGSGEVPVNGEATGAATGGSGTSILVPDETDLAGEDEPILKYEGSTAEAYLTEQPVIPPTDVSSPTVNPEAVDSETEDEPVNTNSPTGPRRLTDSEETEDEDSNLNPEGEEPVGNGGEGDGDENTDGTDGEVGSEEEGAGSDTGNGNTDSGNTDSGNTDNGNTDSGNTDNGSEGAGTDSDVPTTGEATGAEIVVDTETGGEAEQGSGDPGDASELPGEIDPTTVLDPAEDNTTGTEDIEVPVVPVDMEATPDNPTSTPTSPMLNQSNSLELIDPLSEDSLQSGEDGSGALDAADTAAGMGSSTDDEATLESGTSEQPTEGPTADMPEAQIVDPGVDNIPNEPTVDNLPTTDIPEEPDLPITGIDISDELPLGTQNLNPTEQIDDITPVMPGTMDGSNDQNDDSMNGGTPSDGSLGPELSPESEDNMEPGAELEDLV